MTTHFSFSRLCSCAINSLSNSRDSKTIYANMVRLSMLQHRVCPKCGAENLANELVCFSCGAPANRPASRERLPETPWFFYLGAYVLLLLFAVVVFYVARGIAGYRQQADIPTASMLLLVLALALFGQYGFALARRQDRSLWEWKRAPQLSLKQVGPGDDVWLRGTIACDSPLDTPYLPDQPCVYYELIVRQRDEDRQRGWRITQHEEQGVDFSLHEADNSLYVPNGDLEVDAPVCVDNLVDDDMRVKVLALLVGWEVSICGRVGGDGAQRLLRRLSDEVPAIVTSKYPKDYLAELSKSERLHRAAGWALSILAGVVLIATFVKG